MSETYTLEEIEAELTETEQDFTFFVPPLNASAFVEAIKLNHEAVYKSFNIPKTSTSSH